MKDTHLVCTTTDKDWTGTEQHAWVIPCGVSMIKGEVTIDTMTWDASEVTCPKCQAFMDNEEE